MSPKHTNPTRARRDGRNQVWARAPYNFVPLPEKTVPARDPLPLHRYFDPPEARSGWIECELETCSPTYVRGMLTPDRYELLGNKKPDQLTPEEKEEMAPFFATDVEKVEGYPRPTIPGSSLRGMVRSLVEIAGFGRVRWVGAEPTFTFRAVAAAGSDPLREPYQQALGRYGSRVRAGYLVRKGEGWSVLPALTPEDMGWPAKEAYLKVKARNIRSSDLPDYIPLDSTNYRPQLHDVTFDVGIGRSERGTYAYVSRIGTVDAGLPYRGVLACSGNMLETGKPGKTSPRTTHALVLLPDDRATPLPVQPQAIRDYRAGMTPFQGESLEDWGGPGWGCLKQGAPVFYVAEGKEVVYFGHSPNFRIPARLFGGERAATPQDFLPEDPSAERRPDLADAIFGWVEEDGGGPEGQHAGRVSFGDGEYAGARDGVWYRPDPIALHTLSGPKATTFQHYLVQDRDQGHDPDDKRSLAHYGSSPDETQIRGHKLYWHKGTDPDLEASAQERQHEKQLSRVLPLKPGVRFRFSVRFENLRPEELGALWWALALPGEEGQTYRHKLGMGKPLGMGAVAIMPSLYLTDRQARYQGLFEGEGWEEGAEAAEPQVFLDAFEAYVLGQVAPGRDRLLQLERIRHLLALLQWREGDSAWLEATRYMEIQHGPEGNQINEYKERPVLPDPLGVVRMQARPGEPVRPPESKPQAGPPRTKPGAQPPPRSRPQPSGGRLSGVVKWFSDQKGYGFIEQGTGKDIFVHLSDIEGRRSLSEGQRVTYEVGQGRGGKPAAKNVRPE